jgi:putative OPT family oligopeptide transporter
MSEQSVRGASSPFLDSNIPPLPADATPEEKDLHWFTHVYQADRMPQLTVRAVVMGGVIGMLTSVSNLYMTLKIGWAFGVAITAVVLSYVTWNLFRFASGGRLSQMSILENNCMASTASAAGYSTGSTIATCFGAMMLLDPNHQHQPWMLVAAFTLLTGAMGVFLAIPMKRQMINQEQLPFPSGIAAATTLKSLYSEGVEAMRKAYALVIALCVGVVVGILNTGEGTLAALDRFFAWMRTNLVPINLPEQIPEKGFGTIDGKHLLGSGLEMSILMIAAGLIVGLPVSLAMLFSAGINYYVLAPMLAGQDLANAATPGWVVSIPILGGEFYAPTRWSLWGGTAIMVFASLTALALQWKTIVRSFAMIRSGDDPRIASADVQAKMDAIEVPTSWLVAGMVPITIAMVVLQVVAFSIHWWAGVIAVAMSFILSLVACRATGETDTTPIGAMGKVMQLTFAVLMPKQVVPNLVSAGIAANSASSSADLLTDLKSGYLLGANPRKQFIAQFIGIFFGTLAVVPAWYLMVPDIEALEKFPLPATRTWEAVAKVLSSGLEALPMSARWAALVGALIGIALPIIAKYTPQKYRIFVPSAMGLGLGGVVFFSNALSFTIGAFIAFLWSRTAKKSCETYNIPIASGLIAGESMIKAIIAMIATTLKLTGRA